MFFPDLEASAEISSSAQKSAGEGEVDTNVKRY